MTRYLCNSLDRSRVFSVMLLISLLALAGCGGGRNSSSTTSSTSQALAGNWSMTVSSTVQQGTLQFGGLLLSSQGNVTGTLQLTGSSGSTCFEGLFKSGLPIAVTGNLLSNGDAVLTFGSQQTGIVTITGTLDPTSANLQNASFQVANGCDAQDSGSATASGMQAIDGDYNGSVRSGGATYQVEANLSQGASANANGTFPLSGSASIVGSPCFTQGSIASGDPNSFVVGDAFVARFVVTDTSGGTDTIEAEGTFDSAAQTLTVVQSVVSGQGSACNGNEGSGLLIKNQ